MKKKKQRVSPVIAVLLALMFTIIAVSCVDPTDGGGGEGDPTILEGVWEASDDEEITFSGRSFTWINGDKADYKGSFSLSDDGAIIFNISQYSTDGGEKWLSYNQYIDSLIIEGLGISEATWNSYPAELKQQYRDIYSSTTTPPRTTNSGICEFTLFDEDTQLEDTQLIIKYSGPPARTEVYQKAGTSMVSHELVGKWVLESAPTVVVLDFSKSQLKLRRNTTTYTYYTLETEGKIEIGTDPGVFTQDFCTSYTITGDTLTFTGGSSETWYPSTSFKKYAFPPFTPTALTADQWSDGAITSSASEAWYTFNVINGSRYYVWWNDSYSSSTGDGTKTLDVKVSTYYDENTSIFIDRDVAWVTAWSFIANKSGTVYVKVIPYSPSGGTGTFGIAYSTANTRPPVPFTTPANATPLAANVWKDGTITGSETEAWYSFSVSAGNAYYVWWNDGFSSTSGNRIKTLDVRVVAFYANGTNIFTNVDTAWGTAQTFTPTVADTVYLRVAPKTSGNTGTYGIVYSSANTRPNTPPVSIPSAIALTADQWESGEITVAGGEAWYSFPVTNETSYSLWGDGGGYGYGPLKTLRDMRIGAWYDNGTNIFYSTSTPWSSPQSFVAASGGTVYVRVFSSTSSNTGTFGLVYSDTATSRPSVPFNISEMGSLTTLTASQWADGNFSTSNGLQWFTFVATNFASHYIHFSLGTLDAVNVQVYNSTGSAQGNEVILSSSTRYTSTSLVSGQTYYIRVRPNSGSGNYRIAFSGGTNIPANP